MTAACASLNFFTLRLGVLAVDAHLADHERQLRRLQILAHVADEVGRGSAAYSAVASALIMSFQPWNQTKPASS